MVNSTYTKETLKFDFMISLQSVVSLKIANCLWMTSCVKKKITDLSLGHPYDCESRWKDTECFVVAKVQKLGLPASVTKKLSSFVPYAGESLLNWIKYIDYYIFDFDSSGISKAAVGLMNNITWTTRGKIDYSVTAKSILANESTSLSYNHCYKLACTHCLEDEIMSIAPYVVGQDYLKLVDIEKHPMVHFWTTVVTDDYETYAYNLSESIPFSESSYDEDDDEFSFYGGSFSFNELEFRSVTCYKYNENNFNEIPVYYMWNRLKDEEKAKRVFSTIRRFENQDFKFTLLSWLEYEQQNCALKHNSGALLAGMLNDLLWEPYFLDTALQILDKMDKESYVHVLDKLVDKLELYSATGENENLYDNYKFYFEQLWVQASVDLRESFFEYNESSLFNYLFFDVLSWDRDMDAIKAILSNLRAHQKELLISHKDCLRFVRELITQNEPPWTNVDLLISSTFLAEEDIFQFKDKLFNFGRKNLARRLLDHGKIDRLEYFLNWSYWSEDKKNCFKKEVFCQEWVCLRDTFFSIVANKKADFTKLEKQIEWCANGDQEIVKDFKTRVPLKESVKKFMKELMMSDRYELLNEVLQWCFSNDQLSIAEFKKLY